MSDELNEIRVESLQPQENISFSTLLTSRELRWPLITATTLIVGLQVSGINAVSVRTKCELVCRNDN